MGQPIAAKAITVMPTLSKAYNVRLALCLAATRVATSCYTYHMGNTASKNDRSVEDYIASLGDEQTVQDSQVLLKIMQRISGHEPTLWNVGTIGFDTYHYKYDSGREGDAHVIGFYPRKGRITVYLMDGTARHAELLAKLGKHTSTGYCLYIKRLSDIQLPILKHIVRESYEYIKSKSQDGPIDRILWQKYYDSKEE